MMLGELQKDSVKKNNGGEFTKIYRREEQGGYMQDGKMVK